jgi:hypothetical protein
MLQRSRQHPGFHPGDREPRVAEQLLLINMVPRPDLLLQHVD